MERRGDLAVLMGNTHLNALLGWVFVLVVALIGLGSALNGDWIWVLLILAVVALAVLPPAIFREPVVMLPWEVLALVSVPLLGRGFFGGLLADVAGYLGVAAVALVLAVDLDVFTPVKMATWFAGVFVVLTTMATAGIWAVLRYASDVFLGTTLIYPSPPPVSPALEEVALEALMWDFVAATLGGILAGLIFALYFRQIARGRNRLPPAVAEGIE
jgi:hypothetical protein